MPRPGTHASTPARREQIARAALASFAQHGYERASLRDIAARAEITHAALLRHFSGKDELLLAALAQSDADDEILAAQIVASELPAEKILGAVLREEFERPDYQRNWLMLTVAATDPAHPAHAHFVARRARLRTRFTSSILTAAPESNGLSADDRVTLVLAMIDGLRIQTLLDPERASLDLLDEFMRLIGAGEPNAPRD
jgi:AcrR family transcriptional regulator